jgi:hypothetical protein
MATSLVKDAVTESAVESGEDHPAAAADRR